MKRWITLAAVVVLTLGKTPVAIAAPGVIAGFSVSNPAYVQIVSGTWRDPVDGTGPVVISYGYSGYSHSADWWISEPETGRVTVKVSNTPLLRKLIIGAHLPDGTPNWFQWMVGPGTYTYNAPYPVHRISLVGENGQYTIDEIRFEPIPDTDPPPPVTNLRASPGVNQVTLTWDHPESVGVREYVIYADWMEVGRTKATTYTVDGLSGNTLYTIAVSAVDWSGHESPPMTIEVTVEGPDTMPPAVPRGLRYTALPGAALVEWDPNLDADLAGYRVYRDGELVAEITDTSYQLQLAEERWYVVGVSAYDTSGNESEQAEITVHRYVPGSEPPGPVGKPRASVGPHRVELRWSAVPGATEYHVYRDGQWLGTTPNTRWVDTTVNPSTEYQYALVAVNSAGASDPVTITVRTPPPGFLQGASPGMSGLGREVGAGIGLLLQPALVAAGLILGRIITTRGLRWVGVWRRG